VKKRLDVLLVERGIAESRAQAQALVLAGRVRGHAKAGEQLPEDAKLDVEPVARFVSRGGEKLAHALETFGVDVTGADCLDVGASTGGFTDCLLQRGAIKVYAVDVGTNQLAWKLRSDPRVISMEKTNIREVSREQVPEPIDLIVCDASFISLRTALPAALALAASGAHLVALIKPQFEVGKGRVGKGGVVRDPALHQEVCTEVEAWLAAIPGWRVLGIEPSPLLGPAGNREFLIGARRD
jgi:23S rRNA (cytidine1920-2'-O)/16S rRNA (cytidine1409-2'-O)-methyltransferase